MVDTFCEFYEVQIKVGNAKGDCPFAEICNGKTCINPSVNKFISEPNIEVFTQEDIEQEAFLKRLEARGRSSGYNTPN